jgi:hypothetical protein
MEKLLRLSTASVKQRSGNMSINSSNLQVQASRSSMAEESVVKFIVFRRFDPEQSPQSSEHLIVHLPLESSSKLRESPLRDFFPILDDAQASAIYKTF